MKTGTTIYGKKTIFVEMVRVDGDEYPLVETLNSPELFNGNVSINVWSNYTQRWVYVNRENIANFGLYEACRKPILMDEQMSKTFQDIKRSALIQEVKE